MKTYSARWIFMAVVYFVVAVSLGIFMGASKNHSLMSVHAHLNLLGWVSMTLIGVIYHFFPLAGQNRLASVHFWVLNLSLPLMMVVLALKIKGQTGIDPLMGILSMVVGLSVLLFAFNVLFLGRGRQSKQQFVSQTINQPDQPSLRATELSV